MALVDVPVRSAIHRSTSDSRYIALAPTRKYGSECRPVDAHVARVCASTRRSAAVSARVRSRSDDGETVLVMAGEYAHCRSPFLRAGNPYMRECLYFSMFLEKIRERNGESRHHSPSRIFRFMSSSSAVVGSRPPRSDVRSIFAAHVTRSSSYDHALPSLTAPSASSP